MSRGSALTPDEQIRLTATMPDNLLVADLRIFAGVVTKIRECETEQDVIQVQQQQLGDDILPLQQLNTNPGIVELVKTQIRTSIQECIAKQKTEAVQKNVVVRFAALLQAQPNNPILKAIDTHKLWLRVMQPAPRDANQEAKETPQISGALRDYRNAIIQVLDDAKAAEFTAPNQMRIARQYYKAIAIHYLEIKMYENYHKANKAKKESGKNAAVENLLTKLWELYKKENTAEFESELAKFKGNLLAKNQVEKVLELNALLAKPYLDFKQFEHDMTDFRNKQYSLFKSNILYNLLPDLQPKTENDHFPGAKDENDKGRFLHMYQDYQGDLRQIGLTDEQKDRCKRCHDVFAQNIDAVINNNFLDGAIEVMKINLKDVMGIDDKIIQTIVNVMKNALAEKSDLDADFADPELAKILEENNVLDLIQKLKRYDNRRNQTLKELILEKIDAIEMPASLKAMLDNNESIDQFRQNARQHADLQRVYDQKEEEKSALKKQVTDRVDVPLIDLLRAQVLHAAKLYFNPIEKPGFLHKWHHGTQGDMNVVELVCDLFSPNVKSFAQAVVLVCRFIDRHGAASGLHTNSFDTLLSFVLYNEGTPQGIFNMQLANAITLNLNRFYPHYRTDDLHFRRAGGDITKEEVHGMKTYLNEHYQLPGLAMRGRVSSMVRGQERLKKVEERNIVREQMKNNLINMASLIERFKAGQEIGVTAAAQHRAAPK